MPDKKTPPPPPVPPKTGDPTSIPLFLGLLGISGSAIVKAALASNPYGWGIAGLTAIITCILDIAGVNKPSKFEQDRVFKEYMRTNSMYPPNSAQGAVGNNTLPPSTWDLVPTEDKYILKSLGLDVLYKYIAEKYVDTRYGDKNSREERHHIVPQTAKDLDDARTILVRVGIPVTGFEGDAKLNIVKLTYGFHRFLHNDMYYTYVKIHIPERVVGGVDNPLRESVVNQLDKMRAALSKANEIFKSFFGI